MNRREFLSGSAALSSAAAGHAAAPAVPVATLGRTGLKITRLIFGSMITSDPTVIERSVDVGINCFLSARDYQNGNNERLLAAGLGARRKNVILGTSTIDMNWRPNEKEDVRYALSTLETSLRELKTDYLDLWFFHQKNTPEEISEHVPEAIRIAKQQGKIRYAGVTTHKLPRIADALAAQSGIDAVIPIFNFTTAGEEMRSAVEKVHKAGVGVIAMKVMAGGLRSSKPLPQMQRAGALNAALRWVLNDPNVDAAVTSMSDTDQLEDNLRAITQRFSNADRGLLAQAQRNIEGDFCRMCGSCDGTCARGLPVSDVLRFAMYAEGYGHFSLGRERFRTLPAHLQAVRCGECGECTVHCVNGLNVAAKAARAQALFA